jgi:peptidoglycan hydrolase CwlO-like protein
MPIVGWGTLSACTILITKWVWKARGAFDSFVANQKTDRDLVMKTLAGIEIAKADALKEVAEARAHGEKSVVELQEQISATSSKIDTLDKNHLTGIEKGIESLNQKTDKMVDTLTGMAVDIKILVDRTPRLPTS